MNKRFSISLILILSFTLSCKRQDFYQSPKDGSIGRDNPTISLNGSNLITIPLWDTLIDPGATAFDMDGNPLTVYTQTNINYNFAGNYTITYIATDQYGKQSSVVRNVEVVIEQQHYLGDWEVDHNCRTNTLISLLHDEASIIGAFNILTLDHNGKTTSATINGRNITVDPSFITIFVTNGYLFTGAGQMSTDGNSFEILYNYQGISGLARDGSCTAVYTRK